MPVQLSPAYLAILIGIGVLTAGLGALIMWRLSLRKIPKHCDSDGLVLRNGDHYSWSQLNFSSPEMGRQAQKIGYYLQAADTTAIAIPRSAIKQPDRVGRFISLHFPVRK